MMSKIKLFSIIFSVALLVLTGCSSKKHAKKGFKHDTPLIKQDVKKLGKKELEKSAEMGPVPVEGDVIKLEKIKQKY